MKKTFINVTNWLSWIHIFYPYIEKIEMDSSMLKNFSLLVSKLNKSMKNFDFNLLNQEINTIKELLDLATWKELHLRNTENRFWWVIPDEPDIEEINNNLSKWLDHLEQIWLKAKTLNEITISEIKNFLQSKIPYFSDWEEVKKDEFNQIEDCNGWKILENKELQTELKEKNILLDEEKKELKAQLENHGKAGIVEIYFDEFEKSFIGESNDILSGVHVFLDYLNTDDDNVDNTDKITSPFFLKYKKDFKRMKNFVNNCSNIFSINIDTNYIFKNEEIWKNTLIQWKKDLDIF